MMTKNELILLLETERSKFDDLLDQIPDPQMALPGTIGEWSVKDTLAHLSRWEAELIKFLFQVRGLVERPDSLLFATDEDKINAAWQKESQDRELEMVEDDFDAVRRQVIRQLKNFTDKDLLDPKRFPWMDGKPLAELVKDVCVGHEAEHRQMVETWWQQHKED
jgi:hypothetical protein